MTNQYQRVYTFDNGYGASVVSSNMTYGGNQGLFEVAVLDKNGEVCYDTSITNDVVGFLDFADVADILNKIRSL